MSKNIGNLKAKVSLDQSEFARGMSAMRRDAKKFGADMKSLGRKMALSITAPIAAVGGLAIKVAGDFEASMNKVAAISGATGGELEMLSKAAQDMGKTTQFSASEAADALSFLAMAGFDADQAMDALPHTLTLAASAGLDLASSADIVSNVLSGYGLEVGELARVNDVLVKTISSSNTNLSQMGEAMAQVAPIAASAGISFEQASAAIGLFGNAGIQGSAAGTALKNAIAKMLDPTDEVRKKMETMGVSFTDAQNRLLPLDQIVQQLGPHASNTALMIEIFGQRAGPAMSALVSQGTGALQELTNELKNSAGIAAEIAARQMEGFNGALKEFRSALEGLAISIGNSGVLEFAEGMVDKMRNVALGLSEANPKILAFGSAIAGLAAIAAPIIVTLGVLSASIAAISAPVLLVVGGLAALAAVALNVTGALGDTSKAALTTTVAERALEAALKDVNTSSAESVEAGRAVAEQHQKQAQAAVIAARAELALAQAEADAQSADLAARGGEFMNPMALGFENEQIDRITEDYTAKLADAEAGLAGIEAQILSLDVAAALINTPASTSGNSPSVVEEITEDYAALSEEVKKLLVSIDPTIAAEEKMTEATAILDQALAAGLITQTQYNDALVKLGESTGGPNGGAGGMGRLADAAVVAAEKVGDVRKAAKSLAEDIGGAVGDAFSSMFDSLLDGTFNAMDALRSLAKDLAKMAMNAVFKQLLGGMDGGSGGFLSGLFGSLAGARASGGPVEAGKPYIVGEFKKEVFVPNVSGTIMTEDQISSATRGGNMPGARSESAPTIINLMDPSVVGDYLSSGPGKRTLMNVIGRNRGLQGA